MSRGTNDSVLEVVKNKLLQTREEAERAQAEVERLRRELAEERERRKLVGKGAKIRGTDRQRLIDTDLICPGDRWMVDWTPEGIGFSFEFDTEF